MIRFSKEKGCCAVPYSVNISLTERCPLRCPFCFHEYENYHELDFQTVCNYIDELSFLGTAQVQFSGGEPLLYPKLFEIISYSHLRGLRTVMSTSGIGMSEKMAENLKKSGLDCCYISLNGSKEKIHRLTRDGFEYTTQALEVFSKVGLRTAINWVAYHENVRDLPQLIELSKSFGVKYISVLPMKKNNVGMVLNRMDKKDFKDLVHYCTEFKDYLIVDSCFKELNVAMKSDKLSAEGCRAGVYYMAISASGEFMGCPHLDEDGVKCSSIEEYWNKDEKLYKHRKKRTCSCIYQIVNDHKSEEMRDGELIG